MLNCQSQSPAVKRKSPESDQYYFIGKWKLVEETYKDGEISKIYPLHECTKKTTLLFEKEKGNIFFIKKYANGKNCEIIS